VPVQHRQKLKKSKSFKTNENHLQKLANIRGELQSTFKKTFDYPDRNLLHYYVYEVKKKSAILCQKSRNKTKIFIT
jgi:hypothetical protein